MGFHSFVYRRAPGRSARHHAHNDLVARCFALAGTPVIKEPTGLFRTDGKRPDDLTLVPWQSGKSLCWDVTVIMPSGRIIRHWVRPRGRCCSGTRRFSQRRKICQHWKRIPLCAHRGRNFRLNEHNSLPIWEERRKISSASGDDKEGAFLFQRVSVRHLASH